MVELSPAKVSAFFNKHQSIFGKRSEDENASTEGIAMNRHPNPHLAGHLDYAGPLQYTPAREVLLKRVVLQARYTDGLVDPVLSGQGYGPAPKLFGPSGTLIALSATPATMNHFIPPC